MDKDETGIASHHLTSESKFDQCDQATTNDDTNGKGPNRKCAQFLHWIRLSWTLLSLRNLLTKWFPISIWLPNYNLRCDLIPDLIAGITVTIFQIPSMGYGLVAKLQPVHGLYTSLFPAFIYALCGSSRHCSVGTFAVVSLMTGSIVTQYFEDCEIHDKHCREKVQSIDIAATCTFLVGLYQFVFGLFHLGFFSVYLSKQVTSGFTTAASFYVFTSQLSTLFGLDLPYEHGCWALLKTYRNFFRHLAEIHKPTLLISLASTFILLLFKLFITPQIRKRCNSTTLQIPIELFVVIIGTCLSHWLNAKQHWQIQVVGTIPRGLPIPKLPDFSLIAQLAVPCIPLAIVSYSLSISVCKIFAQRYKYAIDSNQELLALGLSNLFSCCFSCMPAAGALSRTAVQVSAGGRTQLVTLINCIGLVLVLYSIGTLFQELPNAILAAIIAVALQNLLLKVKDLHHFWKISKIDGTIWLLTFLAVIVWDVDIGLYIGFACSLFTLIYKSQRPKIQLLGSVDQADIYVPIRKYPTAREIADVKIFQFCGPLHFANTEYFKQSLQRKTNVFPEKIKKAIEQRSKFQHKSIVDKKHDSTRIDERCYFIKTDDGNNGHNNNQHHHQSNDNLPKHIVIDCSMFSYIDSAGVIVLKATVEELQRVGIRTYLAAVANHVNRMLDREEFYPDPPMLNIFTSISDAIHFIKSCNDRCNQNQEPTTLAR